jgi:homoserine dehydrogenase
VKLQKRAYYLRFRVEDRPGIIAKLAGILASKHIGLEAVLQEPCDTKHDLPFVITTEQTSEQSIGEAIEEMSSLDFMREAPLALPMETAL